MIHLPVQHRGVLERAQRRGLQLAGTCRETVLPGNAHDLPGAHAIARNAARLAQLGELGVVPEGAQHHREARGTALHRLHLLDERNAEAGHAGQRSMGTRRLPNCFVMRPATSTARRSKLRT